MLIEGKDLSAGSAGGLQIAMTFTQAIPSTRWRINHGLGRHPLVILTDTAGTQWIAAIVHKDENGNPSNNTLEIQLDFSFAGVAELY